MSADGSYAFSAAPSPEELARFDLNDFGNAMRLIRLVGGEVDDAGSIELASATLLYLREIGWIGWNGRHWDLRLGQRLAERTAHSVAQGLIGQLMFFEARGVPKKEAMTFIRSSGNAGSTSAMLRTAESYLQVELDDFDADPLALNVRNCTLRFKRDPEGGLAISVGRHDPRDRITHMADVDHDPSARCPLWEASVDRWQPEPAMAAYLQRLAGYAFSGEVYEQVFIMLQGKGNDGKSTFVGVLRELLGDYANVADVRTFLDTGMKSASDASPDLVRLAGDCRLVSVSEPQRGAKLAEGMIKSFTGGAPITARALRQGIIEFLPRPKVFLECNSRPVITGSDDGIWRRVRLVMFEHPMQPDQVDKQFLRKLRPEFPGILNWVIEGMAGWLDGGLAEPERVRQTMDDYRKGSSPFGEWFGERLEVEEGAVETAAAFYGDYKGWCEENGIEKPMSQRAFGDALADRQIIRCARGPGGVIRRQGARLKARSGLLGAGGGSAQGLGDDLTGGLEP